MTVSSLPRSRSMNEMIGGEAAELWVEEFDETSYTGARWPAKELFFEGEASASRNAARQLVIYRTVRFATAGE